ACIRSLLSIQFALACDAVTYTRHGFAPGFGYQVSALLAMSQTITTGQVAACALHGIRYGAVNLLLYCAVAGPSISHVDHLMSKADCTIVIVPLSCRQSVTEYRDGNQCAGAARYRTRISVTV